MTNGYSTANTITIFYKCSSSVTFSDSYKSLLFPFSSKSPYPSLTLFFFTSQISKQTFPLCLLLLLLLRLSSRVPEKSKLDSYNSVTYVLFSTNSSYTCVLLPLIETLSLKSIFKGGFVTLCHIYFTISFRSLVILLT